ncbi:hypothetical protein [Paraburkholderia caledonica]|uniref:hypothetical protein n=1 Tax=Paraburkholderia caledonica TaxID=134536 RepID=UPI001D0C0096
MLRHQWLSSCFPYSDEIRLLRLNYLSLTYPHANLKARTSTNMNGREWQCEDSSVNASVISALAALVGAAIGGLTSVLASWLTQRTQVRAEWLAHDRVRRQELYKEFIEEATKCYVDALQHGEPDLHALANLYAKISRMRVQSSRKVADEADLIGRKIVDTYLAPDKTFVELRQMIADGSIDILGNFGEVAARNSSRCARSSSETCSRPVQRGVSSTGGSAR